MYWHVVTQDSITQNIKKMGKPDAVRMATLENIFSVGLYIFRVYENEEIKRTTKLYP